MARSILETVIKIVKEGGGDKETVSALANVKNGLAQAGLYAAAFTGVAYGVKKVLEETAGQWMKYALSISDAVVSTGMQAEEMSRLIQVGDDLRISQENIVSALEFSIRQGYKPTKEWLIQFADQMQKLPPGAERTALAIKTFGRTAGPEMVRMLEMGGPALRDYMASIDEALVVTNANIDEAQDLHLELDELNDQWLALKNTAGKEVVPVLADLLGYYNRLTEGVKESKESWMRFIPGLNQAYAMFMVIKTAIDGDTDAVDANSRAVAVQTEEYLQQLGILPKLNQEYELSAEEVKELSDRYKSLIQTTLSIQGESERYREKLAGLDEQAAGLRSRIIELEGSKYLTDEQKTELETLRGQLDDVQTQMYEAGQEAEMAGKKLVFNLLQAKLAADGLTTAEFNLLIQTGETFGIIDEQSADAAVAINSLVDEFAAGNEPLSAFDTYVRSIMALPQRMSKEVYVQWTETWGSDGGQWQGGQNNNYAQQFGGDYLVTKPTQFLAGEAGPERVTFTPVGSGGRYDLQPVSGGGGGGPIIVQVYLDGRMVQETIANGLAAQGL